MTDRSLSAALPAMSYVILTPHKYETMRKSLRHIAAQNVRDQIEIVIVAPSAARLQPDEAELSVFHSWRVVEAGVYNTSEARVAAIQQARAPIIAFGEDHSFPEPGWAEALLRAHEGPWAVVGPAVWNANPISAGSWANFVVEYGQWMHPAQAGERDHLPGHNSSYKRDILLAYGEQLPAMLDVESALHWDLRRKGYRLYLEPAAQTRHLNPSQLLRWLPNRFYGGRVFAGGRARGWPARRRLYYALGALWLPVRGTQHALQSIRQAGMTRELIPRILPALWLMLVADGLGRAIGYIFGYDRSTHDDLPLEFRRQDYLGKRDLADQSRPDLQTATGE